jgi:hypothetical protein
VKVKRFHDVVCDEEAFRPSENEHLATKLTIAHAELLRRYMGSSLIELKKPWNLINLVLSIRALTCDLYVLHMTPSWD